MRIDARKSALWALVGVASAAACATSASNPAEDDDEGCSSSETDCDGDCVDLAADPANCGECGKTCVSGQCAAGACVSACGDGLIECNGACADPQTDPSNCGACGIACIAPLVCNGSICGPPCPAGQTGCNGACVDLLGDEKNCGKCGTECDAASACTNGVCEAICQPGYSYCGAICVDTALDEQNCGGCGTICQPDQTCETGTCTDVCSGSDTFCSGQCVDVSADESNCGFCGVICSVGQTCDAGQCQCASGVCGSCGVTDLGSMVPQVVNGTTAGASDQLIPSCSFDPAPEKMFTFTAPTAAVYAFNLAGSGYDTVIALLSSACNEIACNDDFGGSLTSLVTASLAANETVHIQVDGFLGDSGPFTLNILEAPPCPMKTLPAVVPGQIVGDTTGLADFYSTQCAFGGGPEETISFTAPAAGTYMFDTIGSGYDTSLYVLDACDGFEITCNDQAGPEAVSVQLAANQTVIVIVDGVGGGSYVLNVSQTPCPAVDLGSVVPQTVNGTTVGKADILFPGCGFGNSGEVTHSFTAPVAGSYTFDTIGSSYDTLLDVLDGTCMGAVLSCDDDSAGGSNETLTVNLAANQTVVVSVDGYGTGNYTLHISSP